MDIKTVRRMNARLLAGEIGSISGLANYLGKTQGQISALIGSNPTKNIGDRLAREIEAAFEKPVGWLDYLETDAEGRPVMTPIQEELYQIVSELTDYQIGALIDFLTRFPAELQRKSPGSPPHVRKVSVQKKPPTSAKKAAAKRR